MARGSLIGWSLSDARPIAAQLQEVRQRVAHPERAYNKMLDEVARRQTEWFATEGAAGGNSPWAARRGRYAQYMQRNFPDRKILHGPDRKGHKGGQLRKELTERPFGVEKITKKGFRYGTNLPYSIVHQQGQNSLPRRRPLRPVDAATRKKFLRILNQHVTVSKSRFNGGRSKSSPVRSLRGSFSTAGGMLSKGQRGR